MTIEPLPKGTRLGPGPTSGSGRTWEVDQLNEVQKSQISYTAYDSLTEWWATVFELAPPDAAKRRAGTERIEVISGKTAAFQKWLDRFLASARKAKDARQSRVLDIWERNGTAYVAYDSFADDLVSSPDIQTVKSEREQVATQPNEPQESGLPPTAQPGSTAPLAEEPESLINGRTPPEAALKAGSPKSPQPAQVADTPEDLVNGETAQGGGASEEPVTGQLEQRAQPGAHATEEVDSVQEPGHEDQAPLWRRKWAVIAAATFLLVALTVALLTLHSDRQAEPPDSDTGVSPALTNLAVSVFESGLGEECRPDDTHGPLHCSNGHWAPRGFEYVPVGRFMMGGASGEEANTQARHAVSITRAFFLQSHEVTQEEWHSVMRTEPSRFLGCGSRCPVERVSWYEALVYANELSKRHRLEECYDFEVLQGVNNLGAGCIDRVDLECAGQLRLHDIDFVGLDCQGYRLPTESEWEYAASYASDDFSDSASGEDALRAAAWFRSNSDVDDTGGQECSRWSRGARVTRCGTHPTGSKTANGIGLHDMLGNVSEWCWDRFGPYPTTLASDSTGPSSGPHRIFRGGHWGNDRRYVDRTFRFHDVPTRRHAGVGIRLARSAP